MFTLLRRVELPRRKLIISWLYEHLSSFEQFIHHFPEVNESTILVPSTQFSESHRRSLLYGSILSSLGEIKSSIQVLFSLQNSPESFLLSTMDCLIDLLSLLFQCSVLVLILYPSLLHLFETVIDSLKPPFFPSVSVMHSQLHPPAKLIRHRNELVNQMQNILESMYLYTESNPDEVVLSPRGIEVLQQQLTQLSDMLRQEAPKQQIQPTPSDEIREEVKQTVSVLQKPEDDGKLYVYQGTASGKETKQIMSNHESPRLEYDHRLLMSELKSSYSQRARNLETVVIGEVIEEDKSVSAPPPPPIHQVSFFSHLTPRHDEEVIESNVFIKHKDKNMIHRTKRAIRCKTKNS